MDKQTEKKRIKKYLDDTTKDNKSKYKKLMDKALKEKNKTSE